MINALAQLGVGLYSYPEAARLLRISRKTLDRWVRGYSLQLRSGQKAYQPVLGTPVDSFTLTFGELVELLYVRGFRNEQVPLQLIREVSEKFRGEWQTPYPFATKRFALHGRSLLLQQGDAWVEALSGQQVAFMLELGRQLTHQGDFALEWRPLGEGSPVLLSPARAFGKPIDENSGAHTYVLADAFGQASSADQVAWWYGTSEEAVLAAVRFESELKQGKSRGLVSV
mgnify:CR=1 FL=1